jgi:hypothetical protein
VGNFRFEDMEGPLAMAPERIGTCLVRADLWGSNGLILLRIC